jgi:predicted SnoaL-like aldol condensation-catalyzing enzyme
MKQAALEFLRLAAMGSVDEAYARYVGEGFVHHNPHFAPGAAALRAGMKASAEQSPGRTLEVQRAIEEGDLVAVHSKVTFPEKRMVIAVVHILRFAGGKIVEMWDVGQVVPEESVNTGGMF